MTTGTLPHPASAATWNSSAHATQPAHAGRHTSPRGPISWHATSPKHLRALIVALIAVMSCVAAFSAPAHAIEGPHRKATSYPEAVLINMGDDASSVTGIGNNIAECTGVLIRPRTVMTAGHCLESGNTKLLFYHWDVRAPYQTNARDHHVDLREPRIVVSTFDWMPRLDVPWGRNALTTHDIGLLCLREPISIPRYPTVSNTPVTQTGNPVAPIGRMDGQLVGDPKTSYADVFLGAPFNVTDHTALTDLLPFYFFSGSKPVTDLGDSGGPVFFSGTHDLVGVTAAQHYSSRTKVLSSVSSVFTRVRGASGELIRWLQSQTAACERAGQFTSRYWTGRGMSQGEGRGVSPGEGRGVSPGEGRGVSPGEGRGVSPGEGRGVSPGEGRGVSPGEGRGVSAGEGGPGRLR
jgi:hypothetical protein